MQNVRIPPTIIQYQAVETEQTQYQLDVFCSILKIVIVVTMALGIAYLIPFLQQQALSALVIGVTMLTVATYSFVTLQFITTGNMSLFVRLWLALATWTVFAFGMLQSSEFLHITALGGVVVIALSAFLEEDRIATYWLIGNVTSFILAIIASVTIDIPRFDLGGLYPIVFYGTPTAVLIIIAQIGKITTQQFKSSLIESETRRKQLEIKEKQLLAYTIEVEDARQQAEKSDRVKSAFLASMSHELRTPLNAIINFTSFVADGDVGDINTQQKELLTDVVVSAKHLLQLINDVLDMSKIEANALTLYVEDNIDLHNIITKIITTGQGLLLDKPVSLKMQIAEDLPQIRCDQQRVTQILVNLMSNACKFTQQGEISVIASSTQHEVIISVCDTGAGIPFEEQDTIFEAFRQSETGLKNGKGTGLGLAISKSLAEAHGGRIRLESVPDKGTTFSVILPIAGTSAS